MRDWFFPIVLGGVAVFGLWALVMVYVVARRQKRAGLAEPYYLQAPTSVAEEDRILAARREDDALLSSLGQIDDLGEYFSDPEVRAKFGPLGLSIPGQMDPYGSDD